MSGYWSSPPQQRVADAIMLPLGYNKLTEPDEVLFHSVLNTALTQHFTKTLFTFISRHCYTQNKVECRERSKNYIYSGVLSELHSASGQGWAESAWSTTHAQLQVIYHILNIEPV